MAALPKLSQTSGTGNLTTGPGAITQATALASPGASSGAPPTLNLDGMATLDDRRALSIGDHLFFRILEDNDQPKQLLVTDSGEIEAPYVGRVQARGMTCKQLAAELKQNLEAKYYYRATVVISLDTMGNGQGKIYASGALRAPGRLEIPGNEKFTLSKAVLCAGGFAEYADKRNVRVTRHVEAKGTNVIFTVDVGQILEKGRTELDLPLEPGDMIFVPQRLIIF